MCEFVPPLGVYVVVKVCWTFLATAALESAKIILFAFVLAVNPDPPRLSVPVDRPYATIQHRSVVGVTLVAVLLPPVLAEVVFVNPREPYIETLLYEIISTTVVELSVVVATTVCDPVGGFRKMKRAMLGLDV